MARHLQANDGYRVLTFESLRTGAEQRHGGVFVTNDTGRGSYFRRDLSAVVQQLVVPLPELGSRPRGGRGRRHQGPDEPVHLGTLRRLGGGMDPSAADLARFGAKLIVGDILSEVSLDVMWTPPNGANNFAYGWASSQVVAMNGSWTGNLAYLGCFPEEGTVVAVQMNDRSGDQNISQLGRDIATMVLDGTPAP